METIIYSQFNLIQYLDALFPYSANWHLFSSNLDLTVKDWIQNIAIPSDKFYWKVGETPLSNWRLIPVIWVMYLLTVFGLKRWVKKRPEFELKRVSAYHNLILCIWSLVMFVGIMYEIIKRFMIEGPIGIYCAITTPATGKIGYWMYIYYLSKFWELFDTIIIVLRKKPLIFLHWYHHAIVILMVWLWLTNNLLYSSMGMAFNTFVHVFMYYFYYVSSLGKTVWWKKYITSIQIIQFISSFLLSIPYVTNTIGYDVEGKFVTRCTGWNTFLFSCFCNFSFLVLFIRFYFSTYRARPSGQTRRVPNKSD